MPKLKHKVLKYDLVENDPGDEQRVNIMSMWRVVEDTIAAIRLDVAKCANGNTLAGRRCRVGLRNVKNAVMILIRETTIRNKQAANRRRKYREENGVEVVNRSVYISRKPKFVKGNM
jgi:hypothetical protein